MRLRRTSAIVHAVLPYAIRPVWLFVRLARLSVARARRRTGRRNVLLICQNPVAADHLVPVIAMLRMNEKIRIEVSNDHFPSQEIGRHEITQKLGIPYVPVLLALFKPWDLVVYVNHPWGFSSWIAPLIRKIYINHGLYSGKINNTEGEDGVYGKSRTIRPWRGLIFDRMFAASVAERDSALAANPALEGRVVVVGSLMADEIREKSARKSEIGKRFELPSKKKVHIISTWGPKSLIATMGDELLDAIGALGTYDFALSLHPRFDKFGGTRRTRSELLRMWEERGVEVDVRNEKWKRFVAECDLAVSDNSSLALYYPILNKPVIFVGVDRAAYLQGSSFDFLSRGRPRLIDVGDLASLLETTLATQACESGVAEIERLCSYLGEAKSRHMEQINALLYT
jgi:hypothetical protein